MSTDRKAAIAAYKERKTIAGVFVVRCAASGEAWVGQDKTKVCGTNPTTTTAPADAAIPAALFLSGCAAG